MEKVKVYANNVPSRYGAGIYAEEMMHNNPLMPAIDEGRLGDAGCGKILFTGESWFNIGGVLTPLGR